MRRFLPAVLVFALGCEAETPDRTIDTAFDLNPTAQPTQPGDTAPGDTFEETDPAAPARPQQRDYVITSIAIAPTTEGHDLDGDGEIDNALGAFAILNGLITSNYTNQELLAALQVTGINDGSPEGGLGVMVGEDFDGTVFDATSGNESITVSEGIDGAGRATQKGLATFSDGFRKVDGSLPPTTLSLGIFAVPISTDIRAVGDTKAREINLLAGGGISVEDAETLVQTFGLGSFFPEIGNLADIDTDNDGVDDTISAAFRLRGGPTEIVIGTGSTP